MPESYGKVCLFKSWQRNPAEKTRSSVYHRNQPERHLTAPFSLPAVGPISLRSPSEA